MIVGVTGYGCTGASACIDLLKEYKGVQSYTAGFEFQILQQVDGIIDLKYHLVYSGRRLATNAAIKRFKKNLRNSRISNIMKNTNGQYIRLSEEYINKLISVKWKGSSVYDPIDLQRKIDRYRFRKINRFINQIISRINSGFHWPLVEERYFSIMDEKTFNSITKEYINKIFEASNIKNDKDSFVIMEQLFNTFHPLEGSEYFDDARSIIIDRDPRDIYLLTNKMMLQRSSGYMPCRGNVKDFVKYYKEIHSKKEENERVIYIQYEDLIYNYEKTCNQISKFLNNAVQEKKGEFFKPEYSINNTMLYMQYPEYNEEYKYIEQELKEYIYPFEKMKKNLSFEPKKVKPFHTQQRVKEK